MSFKKIILKIHLWLGLSSGLIIFILGITGCIYVFEEELKPLIYHNNYYINEIKDDKKALNQLLKIAQDTIGADKPITAISIRNQKNATIEFIAFKEKEKSDGIWYWNQREYYYNTYINPYTGEIQKIKNVTKDFFEVIVFLHWSLLFTTNIGQPIVGISVIIFVISLITGLILWWPKNKSAAKQRFWFQWKSTTKWKRKNYDLHNILGYYMMIFALIIASTGLVWSFDWFEDSVKWIANGGETIEPKKEITSNYSKLIHQNPIDKIYTELNHLYPNAKRYYIIIPKDSLQAQAVYVDYEGSFNNTTVYFDQYNGKLLQTENFTDKNNGEKIRTLNYDIHAGGILGLPGKILAFIASLVAASLPITGFLIWWGRNKKKKKPTI